MSWMPAAVKAHRPHQLFLTTVVFLSMGEPSLDLPSFRCVYAYITNGLRRQKVSQLKWLGAATLGDFISFVEAKHGMEPVKCFSAFISYQGKSLYSHLAWPSIALNVGVVELSPLPVDILAEPESNDVVDSLSEVTVGPKGFRGTDNAA